MPSHAPASPVAEPTPPADALTRAHVALLALGHCLAFADRTLPAVASPLLKADLKLSDAQLGLLQGPAFAVLYAVGMLASLPMAGSRHRFRLLAGCVATWALGMAAFALARSFGELCAARALVGLGQSAFVPLALGLIVEGSVAHWRARAIAVFTAGSVIGRSTALLIGGLALALLARWLPVAALAHWRLLFLAMAAPNALLVVLLLRCRERPPLARGAAVGLGPILAWLRRWPRVTAFYLCAAAASVLVVQTIGAWAPSLLHREQALSPAAAALLFGVALAFASPLGHLLAGTLVDRRRARMTPVTIMAGGLLLTVPLLWLLPDAGSASSACALLALVSLAGGGAAVAALAGLPAMLPAALRSAGARLFLIFVTVVGVGLGPLMAGLVSDAQGPGGDGLSSALSGVCLVAAALGLASASLARGWRRMVAQAAA